MFVVLTSFVKGFVSTGKVGMFRPTFVVQANKQLNTLVPIILKTHKIRFL
jgi:hypothetical protein